MDPTDEQRCGAAVIGLHRAIEAWLAATAPRDGEVLTRFADAHTPAFTMITPEGALLRRDELLPGFERAYGSAPGLTIEIHDLAVVRADTASVTATYVERQSGPPGATARRSTVHFDRDPTAPHGLRIRHLHETWIAPASTSAMTPSETWNRHCA